MKSYSFDHFCDLLCFAVKDSVNAKVYIYHSGNGSSFVKWIYERFFNKRVEASIDRFSISNSDTILHLMSLYYIEEGSYLVNTCPREFGAIPSFIEIGESSNILDLKKYHIIDLWNIVYDPAAIKCGSYDNKHFPEISYYEYLEVFAPPLDISCSIRRQHIGTHGAHGYHATDVRALYDIFLPMAAKHDFSKYNIIDIGCGKGAAMLFFRELGFNSVFGVECNNAICRTLSNNMNTLDIPLAQFDGSEIVYGEYDGSMGYFLTDVQLLNVELDSFDFFFLFNPFSHKTTMNVIDNIIMSIRRNKRQVHIIYAEPICADYLLETGLFRIDSKMKHSIGTLTYYTYVFDGLI